jgi:hypothetical protein
MSKVTQGSARQSHLNVLLNKLTAHADVIRHHIPNNHHNYTLGFAAEAGVRDVIRQILPQRFAVTSGFVRKPGGTLILPTAKNDVSRQTDVIIYDTSHTSPIHSVEGVELVAADDVLAVIEVKDSTDGGVRDEALEHSKELAKAVPHALRGVVLIQAAASNDTEFDKIKTANFDADNAPHVIYCRSLSQNQPYLAFHARLKNTIHFWTYENDHVSPLAAFLRIIASFFAAKGLCSPTIFPDLCPQIPKDEQKKTIPLHPGNEIHSLWTKISSPLTADERQKELKKLLDETGTLVGCPTMISFDEMGHPTAGPTVIIRNDNNQTRYLGAFFIMNTSRALICATSDHQPTNWSITGETTQGYLKRVFALETHQLVENIFDPMHTDLRKAPRG